MKNDSTSDQVINTTATDICDVLKNLSAGKHTIKINGKINNETLNAINKTLQDLNNLDIMISLDLSDTTGLTSIENWAFSYCQSLTSATIPDSVNSIGDMAFSCCESLIVFDVSANNKNYSSSDDGKILYNKDKMKLIAYPTATGDVTILDSVTSIGDYAFCGCDSLTSVTIPNSVTSIGTGAFWGCKSLTNVIIPNSVTSIGDNAFGYCDSLTSVTIPDSVTSIGDWAFCGCKSLTNITIPDSVTSIDDGVFRECISLTSVIIPDSVTSIGDKAFYYCKSLTSVTIPNSVTFIGDDAFDKCTKLEFSKSQK